MVRRSALTSLIAAPIFILMTVPGFGQVLTPPDKTESQQLTPIKIEGVVSDQKKYSFIVKSKDQRYVVKPTPNAVFTLRMNKPIFDFPNRQVRVLKSNSSLESEQAESKGTPGRVAFELPETLYVVSRFEHAQQMQRVMTSKVKRINNYLLTSQKMGDIHPSEDQLFIGGELSPGTEATVAKLVIADKTYSVMLGHRKASMTGFSIADMQPQDTEVYIWGQVDADNSITAHRIEFRPIVSKANETKLSNKTSEKTSKK